MIARPIWPPHRQVQEPKPERTPNELTLRAGIFTCPPVFSQAPPKQNRVATIMAATGACWRRPHDSATVAPDQIGADPCSIRYLIGRSSGFPHDRGRPHPACAIEASRRRMNTRFQVAIIGGGPVGMGLAIELGQRGI